MKHTRQALLASSVLLLAPVWAETPATPTAPTIHAENPEHLQALTQVALATCQVYVLTEFEDGSTAQGGSTRGSISSTHSNMKVVGLEDDKLQDLTNHLCQQVSDAIVARGVKVSDPAALQALPAMAALKAAADPSPLAFDSKGGKGKVYSATGLPLLHVYENGWLARSNMPFSPKVDDDYVSLGDKMGVGFRLTTLQPLVRDLALAAQAPLLHVRLVLAPGGVQASKGGFFASKTETTTTSTLVLPTFTNRLMLTTADGKVARVSLNTAQLSEAGLGDLADVTSGAETAGNVALAAFSILAAASGHGRAVINNSRKQELRTSHEVFDPVVKQHTLPVINALAGGLKTP